MTEFHGAGEEMGSTERLGGKGEAGQGKVEREATEDVPVPKRAEAVVQAGQRPEEESTLAPGSGLRGTIKPSQKSSNQRPEGHKGRAEPRLESQGPGMQTGHQGGQGWTVWRLAHAGG